MDLISILSTVILITTIGTMAVAVAAYVAFKLRDKRKPGKKLITDASSDEWQPIFLTRYKPEATAQGELKAPAAH
ncbi:MAG TPA: hypothetical protein PKD73_17240 [Burkholderiaceae bacterium]|jgi:hypothetical protein|nr:hypothetical protein [Burkholderiaceae bacterium]